MGLLLVVNMKIRSNKFLYTLNVARLNVLCTSRCRRLQRIFSDFWVIFMLFYFCTFALIGNCQRQANAEWRHRRCVCYVWMFHFWARLWWKPPKIGLGVTIGLITEQEQKMKARVRERETMRQNKRERKTEKQVEIKRICIYVWTASRHWAFPVRRVIILNEIKKHFAPFFY